MSMPDTTFERDALKPYLELPHLLSLTWLAYPILSLLFVAFRLQLSLGSAEDAISRAKDSLVASCKAAEQAATATASMPRYLAQATNEQYAEAVNASLNAARQALVLSLTVMEGIINFIIDLYRSTLLCFLELVIRGGLAVIITAVDELNKVVQSVSGGLKTTIQNDITGANSAIQSAIDGINKINPFSDIKAPQITVPDLSSLDNVQLPASISDTLNQLNSTMPTFQDLKEKLEAIIDTPFELVKKDINDTFAAMSFTASGLPVPDQTRLSFCGDVDTSIVDEIGAALIKTAKIGIIVLIILALLLIAANCALEWYKWRCMKRHLEYTRQAWLTDPILYANKVSPVEVAPAPAMTLTDHNLLMLQSNSSSPLITRYVNIISRKLRLSPSKHTSLQWFLSYIFHAPALACLLIGVFGLLSVQIQLLALGPLAAKFEDRAASSVADFNSLITTSVNTNMQNQSAFYADGVNAQVAAAQAQLNNGLFGWVDNTTTTLNATLNGFYTDVQDAVTLVFNNTFMQQPAQEFIRCLIGSKVEALENALTFLHDNLVIQIPQVNNTVLMLSPEAVNEATGPVAAAAIGGGEGDDSGLIGQIIRSYAAGLEKERLMFGIFIALWGVVVLMGIAVLIWHAYIKPSIEARKRRKYEDNKRGLVSSFRGGLGSMNSDDSSLHEPKVEQNDPFPRNASPPRTVLSSQKSWESLVPNDTTTKSAGFTFGISKPKKLMAIGRKAMGRERFVSDEEVKEKERQEIAPWMGNEDRSSTWYGKIAAVLPKPRDDPELADHHIIPAYATNRVKPNLRVDTVAAAPNEQISVETRSRWSTSPNLKKPSRPWISRFSSSVVPGPQPPTTPIQPPLPLSSGFPHPPIGVPIRANQHDVDVPRDVTPVSYQGSGILASAPSPGPMGPVFAPPLHNGFHRPAANGLPVNPRSPPPQQALSPPPSHRRISSVPALKFKKVNAGAHHSVSRSTDLAYDINNTAVNPFATPFDDEHKVMVSPPATNARRSIPTNPFSP
ncbi:plasma membrane fusion protein PRM1 [Flagelloscypha sp. PMI_526]|nr:plasma membrane fusion protein PRM1 [Flagelloscypha sp. PMI_526]